MGIGVLSHHYSLAVAGGSAVAGVRGLDECDNPLCQKIASDIDPQQHVVARAQGDNWNVWRGRVAAVAN